MPFSRFKFTPCCPIRLLNTVGPGATPGAAPELIAGVGPKPVFTFAFACACAFAFAFCTNGVPLDEPFRLLPITGDPAPGIIWAELPKLLENAF